MPYKKNYMAFSSMGLLCVFIFIMLPSASRALDEKGLEERVRIFFKRIHCPVCGGQSIASSDSAIAREMRLLVEKQFRQGKSEAEIRAFLVTRYGDEVSFRPPLRRDTALLWFAPVIFLALSAGLFWHLLFRRR